MKLPLVKDLKGLFISLKPTILDDYRAPDFDPKWDDDIPTMMVTIGCNDINGDWDWGWQTGDNSYTGGAYGYKHWAVVYLTRRSNSTNLARDIRIQLDLLEWER